MKINPYSNKFSSNPNDPNEVIAEIDSLSSLLIARKY